MHTFYEFLKNLDLACRNRVTVSFVNWTQKPEIIEALEVQDILAPAITTPKQ